MTRHSYRSSGASSVIRNGKKGESSKKLYRSAATGRMISESARTAAARARVTADKKRGVQTEQWIIDIAKPS